MSRSSRLLLVLSLGCGGPPREPGSPTGLPTGDPPTLACRAQPDNFLRYDCTVTLSTPAPVTLRWGPLDRPDERRSSSPVAATEHHLVVWGLRAGVEHVVQADETTLAITPDPVPESWGAEVVVTGASTGEAVLLPLRCAPAPTLGVFDTEGRLMAYQVFEAGAIHGYNWTRDGTYLALLDHDEIAEYDLLGRRVTELTRAAGDFAGTGHHEVHRGPGGLLWMLTRATVAQGGTLFHVDRVIGLDAGGEIASWDVADHLLAPLDPADADDATHGNGIWADDAGDLYLSFRQIHTVMKIVGDPLSPDFGDVVWRLTGGAHADEPSDFVIGSASGATEALDFDGQHNPNLGPDGRLGLFDNRRAFGPTARALFFDLDPSTGVADIAEAYELDERCSNQGAAASLADGRRLVTCAPTRTAREYVPGAATPSWTLQAACASSIARVFPVTLPTEL